MTPGGKVAAGALAASPLGVIGLVVIVVAVAIGGAPPPGAGGAIPGVDPTVAAAYFSATAKVGELVPGCKVPWSLIAAIGQIESNHAGGRTVATTGEVTPPIIGIPLNGSRGTAAIADTDGGRLDGDTVWDRAVGPMQFIPSTWAGSGADGNDDGVKDPNNIFDAALATAAYLCRAVPGSDLTSDAHQRRAAFSYNHSSAYVDKVMAAAAGLAAAATAGSGGAVLIVATDGPIQLATVDGITVAASLAPNLAQLLEASRAAGLSLGGGGYRSAAQQIALRRTNGCPDIYTSPASACRPPTARPGQSMHEQGLAIDFTCSGALIKSRSSPCFQWLAANAASYGLYNLPSEPWHFSINGR